MSTSGISPALDPNDPQLTTIPQRIYIPGPLTDPFAKALAAAGDPKAALRADYCGRTARLRCEDNHVDITRQRCGCSGCEDCGPEMLAEICDRWEPAVKEVMAHRAECLAVYLEFCIPQEQDRIAAERSFAAIQGGEDSYFGLHWKRLVGYRNKRLVIRVLCVDPALCTQHTPPADWASLVGYPEGTIVTAQPVHMFQLWWYFEHRLMGPYMPKDHEDRARQQVLFKGMHRFRTSGVELVKPLEINLLSQDVPEGEDLFTGGVELPVKMSDESSTELVNAVESIPRKGSRCRTCGKPHIQMSQWFPRCAPRPEPGDCNWFNVH